MKYGMKVKNGRQVAYRHHMVSGALEAPLIVDSDKGSQRVQS